jgi:putative transferase (TIGR04331 family)
MLIKEGRYLITTADERTWKFDRPVIFLGEWCRTFNRRHIWEKMDAIVAEPYGLGKECKDADYAEANSLVDILFPRFCNVLNQFHDVQYSERSWQIILGHWFRRYVDAMLNRVKSLEQCLNSYQISGTTVYANDHYELTTIDSYSAIWAFNDDRWNNVLVSRILALLESVSFPVEVVKGVETPGFRYDAFVATPSPKRILLKWFRKKVGNFLSWFVRNKDALIINSYLPRKQEIKLQLALLQCPQLRTSPKLEISEKPNTLLRKDLASKVVGKSSSKNLQDILGIMLFELLPICYLEGFKNLERLANQQPWPKYPRFIFTSNNFDTDEVFKLWTATKVELGYQYFVGQHGNNYGTHRYMNPSIEEMTADKFITWGWTDGLPQQTPAFVFKTAGSKAKNYNPKGSLLLIESLLNHRITTWDGAFEFANYFQDQQKFVRELDFMPKQNLFIRLHSAQKYMKWNEEARWQAFDPFVRVDDGVYRINNLIANSRLVVHSYDSTGILETLMQNIPTLAFWQNGFEHLRESAKPYYQLLVDVGIVHLTPDSITQKVNAVWDDVDAWWLKGDLQSARKQFCNQYARASQNPVNELKKLLMS